MKIALSGTAGTGKSTLARALASRLDISAIGENLEPVQGARRVGDFPPRLMRVLHHKRSLEDQAGDFVVLVPWNSFLRVPNNAPVRRNMNVMEQLRHHASIVGHAHMWAARSQIVVIPRAVDRLEPRLDYVLSRIRNRRPELLRDASRS